MAKVTPPEPPVMGSELPESPVITYIATDTINHDGKHYVAGDLIEISGLQANALLALGVIAIKAD